MDNYEEDKSGYSIKGNRFYIGARERVLIERTLVTDAINVWTN